MHQETDVEEVGLALASVRGGASTTAERRGGVCRNIYGFVFSDLGWRQSTVLLQIWLGGY